MSMHFGVTKGQLVQLVSSYQQMEQAQHLGRLMEKGDCSEWLVSALATHPESGISSANAAINARKACFGTNQKEEKEPPSFFSLFIEALDDFVLKILMVSAVLSIALQVGLAAPEDRSIAWIQGFAILIAVFVCSTVAAANNYQKERQFIQLNSVADGKKKVTVWRGGVLMEIHQDLVLVGDVVAVVQGMEIPADGILIESNDITTDQSAMTGETDPVVKNLLSVCTKKRNQSSIMSQSELNSKPVNASPILMSGTRVLTGIGKMIVIVVGPESCLGKIRGILEKDEDDETPLQQKLEVIAEDIGKFGLYSAIFIIVVLLIRFTIIKITIEPWNTDLDVVKILNYFIIGIVVIVVAVPQGLPLSVTLSLAFSVKKMLKDQNLVRRLEACETMGGANNICSDKTGTLTMNKMILTEVWNAKTIKIDTYAEHLTPESLSPNADFVEFFKIATLVNSTALLLPEEKGSSTQIALLKYFNKMGINYQEVRRNYPTTLKIPFSSARKRMSIILEIKGEKYLFIKGASQIVLKSCQFWLNSSTSKVQPLENNIREEINETINSMASNSLRTLCLGFKKLEPDQDITQKNRRGVYQVERENITLIAVIGVRDNPRREVPDAIKKCHLAGITVRMVTGDNIITARSIAKEIGLLKEGGRFIAMEGPEFSQKVGGIVCKNCKTAVCDCPITKKKADELNKQMRVDTVANAEEFDKLADRLLVLARSRPEDKYCLVTGLKQRGNVVAVTGDGTNDAPALKKADVGFAMGISGTEVARQAAAIILIDDNFSSIVKAVLWGRNIYDSIRKFIQFQLTVNVVAVFITMVGAALLQREVIKTIQMLWINLIMDTLASLALATEDPHEGVLLRKPYGRDDYIVSKLMKKNIVGQSLYQIAILMILIFLGETFIPEEWDNLDSQTVYINNPQYKWHNGAVNTTVCSGRYYTIKGDPDYQTAFQATHNFSRHFTFVFNTFVMMQIFNFINARKIYGEINVFKGITENIFFNLITIGIFVIQIILITFGGFVFGVYPEYGLTIKQWGLCIAFGAGSLVVGLILKMIPYGKEKKLREEVDPVVEEAGDVYKKLLEDD